MKSSQLKTLIKESVKEAIQEELKEILLEAVKTPKVTTIASVTSSRWSCCRATNSTTTCYECGRKKISIFKYIR